ncbi:hypothetical protein KR222_008256, partial [Zaprionus bogoriensis]
MLCILNAAVFANTVPTTSKYEQLLLQSVCTSTAYICMIYALSTWLYHSNYSEPRQHIRIVFLVVLLLLIVAQIVALIFILVAQHNSNVGDIVDDHGLLSDFESACNIVLIVVTVITILLLIVVFVYICIITHEKQQEYERRR